MSRRRKADKREPREWMPMFRTVNVPMPADRIEALHALGMDNDAIDKLTAESREVWANDRYTVHVDRDRDDGSVTCLSIKRNDKRPVHDWRHFQRIKNEIAGADVEAVELYPAQSRLVDTANQYWLWCAAPGVAIEVGFPKGAVADAGDAPGVGSKQRPFDPGYAEGWRR